MNVETYLSRYISVKECEICNKKFVKTYNYMYKLYKNKRLTYYCSYTCYRKAGGDSGKYNSKSKK